MRDDGRKLDANLDLVKEDLRKFVKENQLDTLFLSLGGGAKILGYELSRELRICCFDFGAMTRALTYSGCDGNRFARSTHSPFLFRIPFETHMDALEKAFPNLAPAELLAKAHGQLLLEVMKKEVGWTFASWEFDFSRENVSAFRRAFKAYRKRYRRLGAGSIEALPVCHNRHIIRRVFSFLVLWFRIAGSRLKRWMKSKLNTSGQSEASK